MTVGRVRKALGLEKAVRVNKKGQKVDVTKMGRKKEEVPFWPAAPTEEDKMQEMAKEHTIIAEENAKLKDQLAIKSLPVSTTAKKEIEETIESLRAQVKDLEFQLRTMTQSRNEFQSKNAEMIKQMSYWKKRAEKAEKK
jgi:cell division protein FtsB